MSADDLTGELRDNPRLASLVAVARAGASARSVRELALRVLAEVVRATGGERALLLVPAAGDGELAAELAVDRTGEPLTGAGAFARSLPRDVLVRRQAAVQTDWATDESLASSAEALGLRTVMAVPLLAHGQAMGVIYVDDRAAARRFDQADLAFLEALVAQMAPALERAREEAARRARIEAENQRLRALLEQGQPLIGASQAFRAVRELVERAAARDLPVLLIGPSGCGKERLARHLHDCSPRRAGPLVVVSPADLPQGLAESALFGVARGAFTGARRDRIGLVQQAHGGTLLLDEPAELPEAVQAALLRVVEARDVRPVGGDRAQPVDVRIVAACREDPAPGRGALREDLYYRLAGMRIVVPPLAERDGDVLLLVEGLLPGLARQAGRATPALGAAARDALLAHRWPGNLRELRNALQRALLLAGESEPIGPEHLGLEPAPDALQTLAEARRDARDRFERSYLARALAANDWNVSATARALDVARQNLHALIRKHGLARPD